MQPVSGIVSLVCVWLSNTYCIIWTQRSDYKSVFLNYNGNQCPQYVVMFSARFISSTIVLNLKERITQHQYLYKFMTTHTASSTVI